MGKGTPGYWLLEKDPHAGVEPDREVDCLQSFNMVGVGESGTAGGVWLATQLAKSATRREK